MKRGKLIGDSCEEDFESQEGSDESNEEVIFSE
jgi:hypothetical protein